MTENEKVRRNHSEHDSEREAAKNRRVNQKSAQPNGWPWRGPRHAGQNQSEQIEMCFLLESLGSLNVGVGLPEEMGIGFTKQPVGHE